MNIYLLEGERGWSLVDSGMHTPEAKRALDHGLAEAGVAMRDLRRAFITHLHPDHMGMAGTLEDAGVAVAMHRPEIANARLVWSKAHELIDRTYSLFAQHGMPADVDEGMRQAWIAMSRTVDDVRAIEPIDDGAMLDMAGREVRVRWTPGHTDHHAVLVDEREGILFAGDHVLPRITSNIGLYPHSRDDPLGDFLDALRNMRDLPVRHVMPAHGEPFSDLAGRVDELLAHHEARLDAVLAALGTRERTAYEVAHDLFPKLRSPHEERFALAETLAHLRYLERRNRVRVSGNSPVRWRVT